MLAAAKVPQLPVLAPRPLLRQLSSGLKDRTLNFARAGPLFGSVPAGSTTAEDWVRHGQALTERLTEQRSDSFDALDPATAARIYHLYLPTYFFARSLVQAQRPSGNGAVVIGISAPQGCGKTTLVDFLVELFAADGLDCAAVSYDDFYLTGAEQDALAAEHATNPLLQVRGNAGTHDLPLGSATIEALATSAADGGEGRWPVRIPRYDKALRGGRGDRSGLEAWSEVARPPQVLLLEGWMAGFAPLPPAAPSLSAHAGLEQVNEKLASYDAWHRMADGWVVLAIEDTEWVFEWRLQAERAMAAAGRPGMDDEGVRDFVSRYLPAYSAFLPELYRAAAAEGVGGKPTLLARIGSQRQPVPL